MVVGVAVREVRAARPKTFEEVLPDLLALIKRIRLAKFQLQHRRQLLAAASIHPIGIADELEQSIQQELQRIEERPGPPRHPDAVRPRPAPRRHAPAPRGPIVPAVPARAASAARARVRR